MWPPGSQQGCQLWRECLNPPGLSHIDDTDDEVDAVLLSLLNP